MRIKNFDPIDQFAFISACFQGDRNYCFELGHTKIVSWIVYHKFKYNLFIYK